MNNSQENLEAFLAVILDEIRQNRSFAAKLERAIVGAIQPSGSRKKAAGTTPRPKGRRNRRAPAAFDPFVVFKSDEPTLRAALRELSLEELRDLVSDYGMDGSRLALKWKDPERLQNLIVDTVKSRARKGAAFLSDDFIEGRAAASGIDKLSQSNPDLGRILVAWKEIEDRLNALLPAEALQSLPPHPPLALRLEVLRRVPNIVGELVDEISHLAGLRNQLLHGAPLDEGTTRRFLATAGELRARLPA